MDPIHLFDLAARQARWLSTSQAVIASNVSNANTPGYKTQTVQPFAEVLDRTQMQLASTNAAHLALDPAEEQKAVAKDDSPWETTESGNSVSIEQEMIKASDVNRAFSLNASLVKAFHGMLMASVRS
ncbi:MAG TPA: flagellar basal body rod protein FlgB [Lichenihabitans sp.]|nr:flagellar basal body rod protein FlgB [Lichenihabitans sp.]